MATWHSWGRLRLVSMAGLVLVTTAACGSSATGAQNVVPVPVQASSSAPANQSPPSVPSSPTPGAANQTGQIVATTSAGDKLSVTLSFSPLMSPSDVGGALSSCEMDTSRALVVRMRVTATIESSLSAQVSIAWDPQVSYAPFKYATGIYLVSDYSNGPTCEQVNFGSSALVEWQSVQPGATVEFTGYWIFTNTISPLHPNGDLKGLGKILLEPLVTLSQSLASVVYSGERHVQCTQPGEPPANGFYIAGTRPHRLAGGLSTDLVCHS